MCIFHQSCSYIPLCNIIWLISNVIWMIAVYMYFYTFTSNLFCTYYRSKLRIPLVITEICNTWLVSPEDATLLETCNHHEANTRIVRHVSLSDKPVVIVAADTDIFVLLIYAFHKSHPSEKWFVKIEKNRYLDIGDICKTYGEEICDALPDYHSVTGYDTTSYPYKVGKVKPLKKMITQGKSNLLAPLGKQRLSKQDAELHANYHVPWKTRWRFCGDKNPHIRTAEKQV